MNVSSSASLESVVKKSFLFTRTATIDFGSFSLSIWQISRTDNTLNNAELNTSSIDMVELRDVILC